MIFLLPLVTRRAVASLRPPLRVSRETRCHSKLMSKELQHLLTLARQGQLVPQRDFETAALTEPDADLRELFSALTNYHFGGGMRVEYVPTQPTTKDICRKLLEHPTAVISSLLVQDLVTLKSLIDSTLAPIPSEGNPSTI